MIDLTMIYFIGLFLATWVFTIEAQSFLAGLIISLFWPLMLIFFIVLMFIWTLEESNNKGTGI